MEHHHLRRFWLKVDKRGPDDCWPWTGATNGCGYGRIKIAGYLYLAHRVSYVIHKRNFTPNSDYHGRVVRHTCDNRACCNPKHLVLCDQAANVADMIRKGRAWWLDGRSGTIRSPAAGRPSSK